MSRPDQTKLPSSNERPHGVDKHGNIIPPEDEESEYPPGYAPAGPGYSPKTEEVLGNVPEENRDIQTVRVHLGVVNARIVFVRTIPICTIHFKKQSSVSTQYE